jgi:tripartite-type tricarboxylate transporter receptor subunit TctC
MRKPNYNPVTDFAAINRVADVPLAMVVPPSLPVHSVAEYVEFAKRAPNKLTFGSAGVGTPMHLAGEMFKMHTGVDLIHVPFRGAMLALPDLLAGRIDTLIGAVNSILPLIKEGKLRALAVTSASRIPSLPDVPTMTELGFAGFEVGSGAGFVAPAGTPPEIIEKLNREILAFIDDPGLRQRMADIGVEVIGTPPAAYAAQIREEYARWGKVVPAAGIVPE